MRICKWLCNSNVRRAYNSLGCLSLSPVDGGGRVQQATRQTFRSKTRTLKYASECRAYNLVYIVEFSAYKAFAEYLCTHLKNHITSVRDR